MGSRSVGEEGGPLLADACERNAPVDIQVRDDDAGEIRVAKSRLLGVDDEGVYLDNPHASGARKLPPLKVGQKLEVHFMLNEVRYVFKSTVRRLRCTVQLNQKKHVVGIVLAGPRSVQAGQRRTHFRVSMLGDEPVTLEMHAAHPEIEGACAVDAYRCQARLVNLSVGGAGIVIGARESLRFKVGGDVYMTFTLPGEPEPICFLTEIRQIWKVPGGSARRMGLRVKPWPSRRKLELVQQRLQRYITRLQRQQLRRAG